MESKTTQAGFSLVELLTAMMITLIVSAAIFGLLSGGQSAFRLQPELTDRQQNIRLAMALIEKDVGRGGTKMGTYSQVFTNGLDQASAIPSPIFAAQRADFLEVFGNDGNCPDTPIANQNGANLTTQFDFPDCLRSPSMVLLIYPNGETKWGWGHNTHAGGSMLNFPPGQQPPGSQVNSVADMCLIPPPPGGCQPPNLPVRVASLAVVRYEIALDADGAPSLFRSTQGGMSAAAGGYVAAPAADGGWQLVARGVEDLQVHYFTGLGQPPPPPYGQPPPAPWSAQPGAVVNGNEATVVSRVMVTLSARSMADNLQGQTQSAAGTALRGQLTSEITPRSSLLGLQPTSCLFPCAQGWR